jgi:predicted RNase H-like HicB family nuclease
MKKILAIVEKNKSGVFSIYTPETKSAVLNGQGATLSEAIADMKESLNEVIESFLNNREDIPEELKGEIEFIYKYDIATLFGYFDEINLSSFARKNGMNESLLRKYKNGLAFASEQQRKRIEEGLHKLGKSLCEVSL